MKILKNVRPLVFWPTFLMVGFAVAMSFVDLKGFLSAATTANNAILDNMFWMFTGSSFLMVVTIAAVFCSPLAKVRIGGPDAKPLLNRLQWVSVALCTTVAVGIVFWALAEPIYHLYTAPKSIGYEPGSAEAVRFTLSELFLEWTITPYCIYGVPAILFALVYYNNQGQFSLSSMLVPIFGERMNTNEGLRSLIDFLCLFALIFGMASSLGTGVMFLSGSVRYYFPDTPLQLLMAIFIAAIVVTYTISAVSGLQKGIARLSTINVAAMIFVIVAIFLVGPTKYIIGSGMEAAGNYLSNFFKMSLFTGAIADDPWPKWWPIFYFANWFAWAPICAMFLGRISKGYTVREAILVNVVVPCFFSGIWISIFSGTTIHLDLTNGGYLKEILDTKGVDFIFFGVFEKLPLGLFLIGIMTFVAFINYVTAADSSTDAISNLCTKGWNADSDEKKAIPQKLIWGILIGFVAWLLTSFAGIDGIKMLSNLGGVPAMLVGLCFSAALFKIAFDSKIRKQFEIEDVEEEQLKN